ncbi:hypothetical protein GDO86_001496 [Hymenochirus boettgeri]|uniref:Uncharacterized protein n=1 Tax=Hymenochirus boettgeri TaxID=247094 RepID=A0A8T2KEZ3_9PIPI|nr:hypothetical protein GDO86_001496 [Hymenochirus boettgeri]
MAMVTPMSQSLDSWLNKAVEWDQGNLIESQKDICLHLPKLLDFLLQFYETLKHMSPSSSVEKFPCVGQFLGRLCWNNFVVGNEETRNILISCLSCLQSGDPKNAVELQANCWVQNLLCHLFSSSETFSHTDSKPADNLGCITADYHGKLLKNIISLWIKQIKNRKPEDQDCRNNRLFAEDIHALSIRCIPILILPDIIPLLEALLSYHHPEPKEVLDGLFLDSVNDAVLRKKILLSESAVLSLWLRHLPSLEKAVLDLIQKLIAIFYKSFKEMEQVINDSFLPQAAQHPSIFRIADNIFRNAILETDGNIKILTVIWMFTRCFSQIYRNNNTQDRFPLKAYIPWCDRSLLMALLRDTLGLPPAVCLQHLHSITKMLKILTKDARSPEHVFECWFLLIHFVDWVDIAAELLMTSECEISNDLLWLLAFYYNPWNGNQELSKTMAASRTVLDRLLKLPSSTLICALTLEEIFEEGKVVDCHPCTLQLLRHLFVTFLVFFQECNNTAKAFISHMTQTQEAASEVSDLLTRTVCRLSISAVKNEKLINIAQELLHNS